ncbi:MAG: hypothetical protein U0T81_15075 [Saprospiraceae bacterium]
MKGLKMHEVYTRFAEDFMAMPVIKGAKTANERFAGAEETYTIEAMMQDGRRCKLALHIIWDKILPKLFEVKYL